MSLPAAFALAANVLVARHLSAPADAAVSCAKTVYCMNGMSSTWDDYTKREFKTTGTTCEVECAGQCCVGYQACDVGVFAVCADGSCNSRDGEQACNKVGVDGDVGLISGGSCVGDAACYKAGSKSQLTSSGGGNTMVGDISEGSCVGDRACYKAGYSHGGNSVLGNISGSSCIGSEACVKAGYSGDYGNATVGNISEGSCGDDYACSNVGCSYGGNSVLGDISGGSCVASRACFKAGFSGDYGNATVGNISEGSCRDDYACEKVGCSYGGNSVLGDISGGSCVGNYACFKAGYSEEGDATVGNISEESCGDDYACSKVGCSYGGNSVLGNISGGSCVGYYACKKAGYNFEGDATVGNISEESCGDDDACYRAGYSWGGNSVLGNISGGSCVGYYACKKAGYNVEGDATVGNISEGSCVHDYACSSAGYSWEGNSVLGNISGGSCVGKYACKKAGYNFEGDATVGNISEGSCVGYYACSEVGSTEEGDAKAGDISEASCVGYYACYKAGYQGVMGNISGNSCGNNKACYGAGEGGEVGNISGNSCGGDEACYHVGHYGVVGNISGNSCGSNRACFYAGWHGVIGDIAGSCNEVQACSQLGNGNENFQVSLDTCCNSARECENAGCIDFSSFTCPSAPPLPETCTLIHPSSQPSMVSSQQPSTHPSIQPSSQPSAVPSQHPSHLPSVQPSQQPSHLPSSQPSVEPSTLPSQQPSILPSNEPSDQPSSLPSQSTLPSVKPSSQPSTIPSQQPSSLPSIQPSVQPSTGLPSSLPSIQPSIQPSALPSQQPSSLPSIEPSIQPSTVPSQRPSSLPSIQPSVQPSTELPSSLPSIQPSIQPSTLPSQQPSSLPSIEPNSQPLAVLSQPTPKPTLAPTTKPTPPPGMEMTQVVSVNTTSNVMTESTIGSSVTMEGLILPTDATAKEAFLLAFAGTLKDFLSSNLDNDRVTCKQVVITSVNGDTQAVTSNGATRRLNQGEILWETIMEAITTVTTVAQGGRIVGVFVNGGEQPTADITSSSTSAAILAAIAGEGTIATQLLASVSQVMDQATLPSSTGACSFVAILQAAVVEAASGDAELSATLTELARNVVVTSVATDQTQAIVSSQTIATAPAVTEILEVVSAIVTAVVSRVWYPDWSTSQSVTCLNDGDPPFYMVSTGLFLETSRESCCERYFGWEYATCAGNSAVIPTGFHPDWSSSESKCRGVTDAVPAYMRKHPTTWLSDSVVSCCKRFYGWEETKCLVNSGGNVVSAFSNLFYVNHEKMICQQDCPDGDGATCGGPVDSWKTLYGTAKECCAKRLAWIAAATCESLTTLVPATGSSLWYIDWDNYKCVKDCNVSSDMNCGGLRGGDWDTLYPTSTECCAKISWVASSECTA